MIRILLTGLGIAAVSFGAASAQDRETAVFAGGCFWCVEEAFDAVGGVLQTTSGYTGGSVDNPTYRQVTAQDTGHYEAVEVVYDPSQVSYEELLDAFWHNVDPFDERGQFCDKGPSYRSAIFVDAAQEDAAEASKEAVAARFSESIATEILPAATFWPAEDYHQNYYQTNSLKYKYYKNACGRAQRLEQIWGAKSG